jgi:hypothetical protein
VTAGHPSGLISRSQIRQIPPTANPRTIWGAADRQDALDPVGFDSEVDQHAPVDTPWIVGTFSMIGPLKRALILASSADQCDRTDPAAGTRSMGRFLPVAWAMSSTA